jgi:hypothetical protein
MKEGQKKKTASVDMTQEINVEKQFSSRVIASLKCGGQPH